MSERFWEHLTLDELDDVQWEKLCDGCGRCCLHKFIDEESDELFFTDVRCRYLDTKQTPSPKQNHSSNPGMQLSSSETSVTSATVSSACACTQYPKRQSKVKDCMDLRHVPREQLAWMPQTCAYRRLYEKKPLASWHPLKTGSRHEMDKQKISLKFHSVKSETELHADEIEFREIKWVS